MGALKPHELRTLNLAQDKVMNDAITDVSAIAQGTDADNGIRMTREDMMGVAARVRDDLSNLWHDIEYPHKNRVSPYKPCPWGEHHIVGPKADSKVHARIGCTNTGCPMFHVFMSEIEWNARKG